jgi:hypothetical protein
MELFERKKLRADLHFENRSCEAGAGSAPCIRTTMQTRPVTSATILFCRMAASNFVPHAATTAMTRFYVLLIQNDRKPL